MENVVIMEKLIFATKNLGKVKEMRAILSGLPINIVSDEDVVSFTLSKLEGVKGEKRRAWFETALVLIAPDKRSWVFHGKVDGIISEVPRGVYRPKLPYDVIFIPEGHTKTFAEMTDVEKNSISHRGRAFAELRRFIATISVSAETEIGENMTIPTKKLKSGFEMPVFGIGTWQMGGRFERNRDNDDAVDIAAIRTAIALGVTHVDTAESYAAGYAERIVGEALHGYDRSKLFVVSKVSKWNLHYDDVIKSARASLEHDIMLIAWRPVQKGILTQRGISVLDEMCDKYGRTPAQIAINRLISQSGIVTLAKTTTLEHLRENLGAIGWNMSEDDIERLRREFPNQQDISDAVPLA